MAVKELRGITPTFQAVLNKQIAKAMDAIDDGDLFRAYEVIKTLIDALKPVHSDDFLKNDVAHIDGQISACLRLEGVDLYQQRRKRRAASETVVRRNIRNLFRKVMRKLHEGGYLEIHKPTVPSGREKGLRV